MVGSESSQVLGIQSPQGAWCRVVLPPHPALSHCTLPAPQILIAASDLGLFDALAPGTLEAAMVTWALCSKLRGTWLLLDACAALGLVQVEDDNRGGEDAIIEGWDLEVMAS